MALADEPMPIEFDGGDGKDAVVLRTGVGDLGGSFERLEVAEISAVTLGRAIAVDELVIGQSGTLTLAAGAGIRVATKRSGMAASTRSLLDLNDNELLVEGGEVAVIEGLVRAARNGARGRRTGSGIGSSAAAADPLRTVAVGRDAGGVLVKYTWNGDANLDGRINSDDYFLIDSAFLGQRPSVATSTPVTATLATSTTASFADVEPPQQVVRERVARPVFSDRPITVAGSVRRTNVTRRR